MDDTITIEECITRLDTIRHELVSNSRDHFALSAGIAALYELEKGTPTVNRWIPCSERLPEEGQDVIIYIIAEGWNITPIQVAHIQYDSILWEFSDGEFYPSKNEVSHWMPLPEPPEEG